MPLWPCSSDCERRQGAELTTTGPAVDPMGYENQQLRDRNGLRVEKSQVEIEGTEESRDWGLYAFLATRAILEAGDNGDEMVSRQTTLLSAQRLGTKPSPGS